MEREKLIEDTYAFIAKQMNDDGKRLLPNIKTVKKQLLPDVKEYEGKVFAVLNATQHDKHNYVDARACVLLDKEDYDWWMSHQDVEFLINGEYSAFYDVLETAIDVPMEIHRLLSIDELIWDNHKLKKVLGGVKQDYIEKHDLDSSGSEGEEREDALIRHVKRRKL